MSYRSLKRVLGETSLERKFLTLTRSDFRRFLKKHPSMREQIVTVATERGAMNRKLLEQSLAETEPPMHAP